LAAAVGTMVVVAVALALPADEGKAVVLAGAIVFILVLRLNPEFWLRRLAGGLLGSGGLAAVLPEFDFALRTDTLAFALHQGGSLLPYLLVVCGMGCAVLELLRSRPPRAPAHHGDVVFGNKAEFHGPIVVTSLSNALHLIASDPHRALQAGQAGLSPQADNGTNRESASDRNRRIAIALVCLFGALLALALAYLLPRARPTPPHPRANAQPPDPPRVLAPH